MNSVVLVGRLTKDCEVKAYDTHQVMSFTIAVDRDYIKKDGTKDTDFINIEYGRKDLSKLAPYVKKGVLVAVDGSLNLDKYTKDGETKYFTKVRAKNLNLLSKAGEGQASAPQPPTGFDDIPVGNDVDDSDIPF